MVAGFLVLGLLAGLAAGAGALLLGQALWVAALAYMLGGMVAFGLGLGLGLTARRVQAGLRAEAARHGGAGLRHRHGH